MNTNSLRIIGIIGALLALSCGGKEPPHGQGGSGGTGSGGGGSGGEAQGGGGGSGGAPECDEGATEACYGADPATKDVGECRGGVRTCRSGRWSGCEGEVTPVEEDPCNLRDDDCDGSVVRNEDWKVCVATGLRWMNYKRSQLEEHPRGGFTVSTRIPTYDGKVLFTYDRGSISTYIPGVPTGDVDLGRNNFDSPPYFAAVDDYHNNSIHGIWVATMEDGASVLLSGTVLPGSGKVQGIVVDAFDAGWVATDAPALYKFDLTINRNDNSTRIVTFDGESAPGVPLPLAPNGLVADTRGFLWTGSNPSLRIEPHAVTWEEVPHSGAGRPFAYGDEVWFAGDPVHVVSADPPFTERRVEGIAAEAVQVTLGNVLALHEGVIHEIDTDTMTARPMEIPPEYPPVKALVADGAGHFVALFGTSDLAIYDVLERRWSIYGPFSEPLVGDQDLVDGTQEPLPFGVARDDEELETDIWSLDWFQETPGKSRVTVHVTFADSREGLSSSRQTCTFHQPPADLRACSSGKRFMRVTLILHKVGDDVPRVREIYRFGDPLPQ